MKSLKEIPYPELTSWSFERTVLKTNPFDDYRKFNPIPFTRKTISEAIFSRFLLKTKILEENRRWITYKVLKRLFKFFFKIFNRLEVRGIKNIPEKGIFFVNHAGTWDPLIVWATTPHPTSTFLALGIPWFEKILQRTYFMLGGHGPRNEILETMIRIILLKNRYYAIWPEGVKSTPPGMVMKGYSGIIRLYSALNAKRDLVPLIPVLIRGSYDYGYPMKLNTRKINIEYFEPIYLDREWLKHPKEGGKAPREMIDFLMNFLARKNGQKLASKNPHLVNRRRNYKNWEFWSIK